MGRQLSLLATFVFKPVDRVAMRTDVVVPVKLLRTCTPAQMAAVNLRHELGSTFREIAAAIGGSQWRARRQYRIGIAKVVGLMPTMLASNFDRNAMEELSAKVPYRWSHTTKPVPKCGLQRCTRKQRIVFMLRTQRQMTFESIGAKLGCSRQNARRVFLAARANVSAKFPTSEDPHGTIAEEDEPVDLHARRRR